MVVIQLKSISPGPVRLGATRAQADCGALREALGKASGAEAEVVVFDFDGIEHTNTSYVRNSLYWFHACGRLFASGERGGGNSDWDIRPMPIIPVARNVAPEVREAIDEVFFVRGAACLEVSDEGMASARILGSIENKLFGALRHICASGTGHVTAASLHERFGTTEDVGVTAWNNRLSDLYRLLLVTRTRHGKFWHYQQITKGVEDGRGPRT